jgi:hypothetical protein
MATQSSSTRSDFYVYALLRDTGVPFYIGKGRGSRWKTHECEARNGTRSHKCEIIRGMKACGVEVIRVKLHEGLTEAVAHAYEIALIAAIGRCPDGPLANHTDGGEGVTGLQHTPETQARISAALRGRKWSPESIARLSATVRGRKMTPEGIAKMAASKCGSKASPEARANISAALRGKKLTPEHIENAAATKRGKKQSPEHIAKLAAVRRGKKRSPESIARYRAASFIREAARRAAKALLLSAAP